MKILSDENEGKFGIFIRFVLYNSYVRFANVFFYKNI